MTGTLNTLGTELSDLVAAVGAFQLKSVDRLLKPIEMFLEHEEPVVPGGGHVIGSVTPDKSHIKDRHFCIGR